jgi:glycosyltransferase involved in cell wall biosynthesis
VSASNKKISIIIPTLNEQNGIEHTIRRIPISSLLDEFGYHAEIIVVDGESTDLTREVAKKMGAKVVIERRKGYGRACKSGFAVATGQILVTLDADDTYPADYIPKYIRILNDKDLDFITVNRFSAVEKGAMSPINKFGNKILTVTMRMLYSIDVKDSQSGMWIMKNSFISQINLYSDGMSISEEIKIIAFKFFKSIEIDGKYYSRTGKAKLNVIRDGWKNLKFLFDYKKMIKLALTPSSSGSKDAEISLKGF